MKTNLLLFLLCSFRLVLAQEKYQGPPPPPIKADPHARAHDIKQTTDGFLWIATQAGLYRYRGSGYKLFTNNPADPWSISGNIVTVLFEDSKGHLWVGTAKNGLNLYDADHQGFYHITHRDGQQKGLTHNFITGVSEDPSGAIWVVSKNQYVDCFRMPASGLSDPDLNAALNWSGRCAGIPESNDPDTQKVSTISLLKNGRLVLANREGIYDIDWKNNQATVLQKGNAATPADTLKQPWRHTWWAWLLYTIIVGLLVLWIYRLKNNRNQLQSQLVLAQESTHRLAELEQIKTRFFSNVAHEFRTPLTLILEPVRQLLQDTPDRNLAAKLRLVEKNSQRLLALVNQLLDFSKLENQRIQPDLSKANLLHTIRPIYQSFFVLADSKSIKLHFKADADIVDFYFDHVMVEKIVSNLLSNAIKFTEAGGKVDLKITQETTLPDASGAQQETASYLVIVVKDTGIGIEPAHLSTIFNRFSQIENSLISRSEGTGIGLALVKEFAELQGGKVTVESEYGSGSTFKVYLPFRLTRPDHTPAETKPAIGISNPIQQGIEAFGGVGEGAAPRESNLILLVENDMDMRQFVKDILLVQGYHVIEASNGEEGIEKAARLLPDLIITDLKMPGKDGIALTQAVKSNEKTSLIPVIILTAQAESERKIASLQAGADTYLTKPFRTEELTAYIVQLLGNRKRQQHKKSEKTAPAPATPIEVSADSEHNFLRALSLVIEQNIENESLGVQQLADAMAISRTHLYRKVKTLTDQNVLDFIRNYRLDRAKQMLQNQEGKVNEVAHKTGFPSPKHFSRVFKERFGVSPGALK